MSDKRLLDKKWRRQNLWHIKNKNGQLVKMKQNRAQIHFNQNKWNRNIILKSRQLGFTTEEAVDMLDDVSFTPNYDALFVAQDLDTAMDIFNNKIDVAWSNFILKDHYIVNRDSARQLKLNLGTKEKPLISSITVDSSGRSGTFRRVHVSEFGPLCKKFPSKAREIISGTIPAVPLDGRVDFESTADGSDGLFYDMFWEAWDRGEPTLPTHYKAHFYNWQWDDSEIEKITDGQIKEFLGSKDYDLFKNYQLQHNLADDEITYYYLKWLSLNKDWKELRKEYPTTPHEAFISSGNKLFDDVVLGKQTIQEPTKVLGDWIFYEEEKQGHEYVWGADVGEGVGADHSAITVIDCTPIKPKVVAIYKNNKIAPDLLAYEIKNIATKYNYAFGAPERNNHGHTTISKLREIYKEDLMYKAEDERFGWLSTLVTKPKMYFDLNTAVNNESIDLTSKYILSEARRYDKEALRVKTHSDDETEHFDLLTSTAIAFQMISVREQSKGNITTTAKPNWKGFNRRS